MYFSEVGREYRKYKGGVKDNGERRVKWSEEMRTDQRGIIRIDDGTYYYINLQLLCHFRHDKHHRLLSLLLTTLQNSKVEFYWGIHLSPDSL